MPIALLSCCLVAGQDFVVRVEQPIPKLHVGRDFSKALGQAKSVRWLNVAQRTMLRRITEEWQLAILRDRRLDPDKVVSLTTTEKPVRELLHEIAAAVEGGESIVGNTLYIGPRNSAAKLRTIIELRWQELNDPQREIRRARMLDMGKSKTFHWNDLDRPVDILRGIAAHYGLKIVGLEKIPHDLWAGGTLPQSDAVEALSLILIQFNLTFEWREQGDAVEFVPVPKTVTLTRSYTPRRQTPVAAVLAWKQKIPGLVARVEKKQVIVEALLEQHEAVKALLRPKSQRPPRKTGPTPLDRQRLTLRVMGVPAVALMKDLEKRFKLKFEYDATRLKAAEVDLEQKVDIDVKQATIEEYLAAIFSPLGAKAERDGLRVTVMVEQ